MGSEVLSSSVMTPDPLPQDVAEALARAGAQLGPFHHQVRWYDEVGSTNDLAVTAADGGVPEGLVIAANAQSAGRGRLGRSWASPAGAGLYVSTVLRPSRDAHSLITIATGVAIAEGIEAATGLRPSLKWPNDVYVGSRKLAGILAEGGSSAAGDYVVIGIGINLRPAAYLSDVAARATSIEGELGRQVDRGLVLAECLGTLAARYAMLQLGDGDAVVAAWRGRAAGHLGRSVEWDGQEGRRRGIAQDIDARGALLVRVNDQIVRVISGEVRWLT